MNELGENKEISEGQNGVYTPGNQSNRAVGRPPEIGYRALSPEEQETLKSRIAGLQETQN
jgi:hypothetical protein